MNGLAYLLWYLPIAVLAPLIMSACRRDSVKEIVRAAAKDFVLITGIFILSGAVLFLIHNL